MQSLAPADPHPLSDDRASSVDERFLLGVLVGLGAAEDHPSGKRRRKLLKHAARIYGELSKRLEAMADSAAGNE
jgi:hypothetical protein